MLLLLQVLLINQSVWQIRILTAFWGPQLSVWNVVNCSKCRKVKSVQWTWDISVCIKFSTNHFWIERQTSIATPGERYRPKSVFIKKEILNKQRLVPGNLNKQGFGIFKVGLVCLECGCLSVMLTHLFIWFHVNKSNFVPIITLLYQG